jgi:peptidoglycan/xylan/chitin deacetylase (PgdA/CDA1 family)
MKSENKVSIIMYHYVRQLGNSRYPNIKGLDLPLFIEQISYLQRNYNIITMEQLILALDDLESLPKKAALLTFDDAYLDHFINVFPILFNRKIQGSFFIPAKTILENRVLSVNKIHFILASTNDIDKLIKRTFSELDNYRTEFNLESNEFYFEKLAMANRFDSKEVIFFKRLLQKELPERLQELITNCLFEEFVGMSESAFSRELYMSKEQMICMINNGMHIGNHGYDHYWLNTLSEEKQSIEVEKGCEFLKSIGVDMSNWTMCYPYGAFNESLKSVLQRNGCKLGLTTHVNIADLAIYNRFELPRLDTNDIPKDALAGPNDWYAKG